MEAASYVRLAAALDDVFLSEVLSDGAHAAQTEQGTLVATARETVGLGLGALYPVTVHLILGTQSVHPENRFSPRSFYTPVGKCSRNRDRL